MTEPKRYWMTLVERDAAPGGIQPEFATHPQADLMATRRSFLKAAGFSVAGLMAANCRPAPQHAVPYARLPELTPGKAYSYASTCGACESRCGLLVTTHDGRPTKIEGNPDHPLSLGATCAAGQASVLSLYDSQRLKTPLKQGKEATWEEIDRDVIAKLDQVRASGGDQNNAVRLVTATVNSPTLSKAIADFIASIPNAKHVVYDPISVSAILDAHQITHGVRMLPRYHFERAEAIVSLDADFLGTWISPVEYTRGYSARRRVQAAKVHRYHAQLESRMSLTGSKADRRVRVAPGDIGAVASHLAARLADKAGSPVAWTLPELPVTPAVLDELVDRLWTSRGDALVVSGSQDVRVQVLVNFINHLLRTYESAIGDQPSHQRAGSDADLETLRGELSRGEIAALIIAGVNPVYDLPNGAAFASDLKKVGLVVAVADRVDETAAAAHLVAPDHHFLESWGDAEPVTGIVSLSQPSIAPLLETRALVESIAAWTGKPARAYDQLRAQWETAIYPRCGSTDAFDKFWNAALEKGVVEVGAAPAPMPAGGTRVPPYVPPVTPVFNVAAVQPVVRVTAEGLALVLHPSVGMGDGRHGHNPWLHEMPDAVTKVTWNNYASFSPERAAKLGLAHGDAVKVTAGSVSLELPAFIQPGQHDDVVAIPLGFGRTGTDRFTDIGPQWISARPSSGLVGVSAAPLITVADGIRRYSGAYVEVAKTGARRVLATTQTHHSLTVAGALNAKSAESPGIILETTEAQLAHPQGHALPADLSAGASAKAEAHSAEAGELWPRDHTYPGYRWGMVVDLDSCTGCSACVVACQSENNTPVVGQDEIVRQREMHWLRIDRYYAGEGDGVEVAHQPMMCQQCEHAPCETVCPVLATVHSSEGLNEQVYNRCVGTRYCANNCPYKVRRFNWFDYVGATHASPLQGRLENLALNPNVTVRARGVMEKCTFCVQRIEEARIDAQAHGSGIVDGAVKTACQQTCPADAIVFGNLNDPKSRVSQLVEGQRTYRVLEEINTRPSVHYLKIVRADGRPQGAAPTAEGAGPSTRPSDAHE